MTTQTYNVIVQWTSNKTRKAGKRILTPRPCTLKEAQTILSKFKPPPYRWPGRVHTIERTEDADILNPLITKER